MECMHKGRFILMLDRFEIDKGCIYVELYITPKKSANR